MANTVTEKTFKRTMLRSLTLPLVLMIILAGFFLWQISSLLQASQRVEHTDRVIADANDTLRLLIDLETGYRGYLVAGTPNYLEPYNRASAEIEPAFDNLTRLVSDNPPQVARLQQIRARLREWRDYTRMVMDTFNSNRDHLSLVRTGQGKRLMDIMRAEFNGFVKTEESLRDERAQATRRATEFAIISAVGLTVLLGSIIAYISRKDLRHLSRSFTAAIASEREGRERLRVTLGSIGDAVIATHHDGRVTFMNPVAQKLTGWSEEQAAGVPAEQVFRIVNEDSREAIESPIARVLREHQVVGLENHALLITKDGDEIPIDDSCAPIKNDKGEIVGAVLAFRDVSARRNAERERLEMQQSQLAMKEQQLQMREQEAAMQAERAQLVDKQLRLQNELVQMQATRLAELSTPLIPLSKQIVVMPLIGTIDSARATQILEAVTQGINHTHARFAIIDITGVRTVDTHVASVLINAAQAVQLLGSEVILTGIKPQVAQTLVNLGINLDELQTRSTLERGIAYANQKADATIIQTLN